MKKCFAMFVFLTLTATAQVGDILPRLMRTQQSSAIGGGLEDTCVLVRLNGTFHTERSTQSLGDRRTNVRVFEGTLSQADLAELKHILDDKNLADVKSSTPGGGILNSMDMLQAMILRGDHYQSFIFMTADAKNKFKDALKPLEKWLKDFKKRKLQEVKPANPNSCLAVSTDPQVPPK